MMSDNGDQSMSESEEDSTDKEMVITRAELYQFQAAKRNRYKKEKNHIREHNMKNLPTSYTLLAF